MMGANDQVGICLEGAYRFYPQKKEYPNAFRQLAGLVLFIYTLVYPPSSHNSDIAPENKSFDDKI